MDSLQVKKWFPICWAGIPLHLKFWAFSDTSHRNSCITTKETPIGSGRTDCCALTDSPKSKARALATRSARRASIMTSASSLSEPWGGSMRCCAAPPTSASVWRSGAPTRCGLSTWHKVLHGSLNALFVWAYQPWKYFCCASSPTYSSDSNNQQNDLRKHRLCATYGDKKNVKTTNKNKCW